MALRSLLRCPACAKQGIDAFDRLFLPAWRTIYCRSCGATFRLAPAWRWIRIAATVVIGLPALYVAFESSDPSHRIAALLVLAAVLLLHAYRPIVRTGQFD